MLHKNSLDIFEDVDDFIFDINVTKVICNNRTNVPVVMEIASRMVMAAIELVVFLPLVD